MSSARGTIRNREYASRIRDFSGLLFGKITPTDIDGFIEFNDRVFIFIEAKYGEGKMPFGQRLALEHVVDALAETGRKSIALICYYDELGDVDFANSRVIEYRYGGQWRDDDRGLTLREAIERFLEAQAVDIYDRWRYSQ